MLENLRKFGGVYRNEGLVVALIRVRLWLSIVFASQLYTLWTIRYDNSSWFVRRRAKRRIKKFVNCPKISVVMPVYNPKLKFLALAIDSVRKQCYTNWELCIADDASTDISVRKYLKQFEASDPRIKVTFRSINGHISEASNSALSIADGKYVALMDHDDLLSPLALFWMADAINSHPTADLLYSDEDKVDARGRRYDPHFKSDWNPDLFLSYNYFSHLGVFRAELLRELGGFRVGFEGAQDYDLVLRCIEQIDSGRVYHVPRILYHWRAVSGSTALCGDEKPYALLAGQAALSEHLQRLGIGAEVEAIDNSHYRINYSLPDPAPRVSIIIPTRDHLTHLKKCIDSIFALTRYRDYEIVIVDNGSCEQETLCYFDQIRSNNAIKIVKDELPFNFSQLNNLAVIHADGDVLVLMNNDVEVLKPEWLGEMVSLAMRPETGAVGARLWYAGDTLQHGGVVLGIGGVAGHAHRHLLKGGHGYFRRAELLQNFSAVTAACLAVRRDVFTAVGGMDETLPVAFNDIDFCLKLHSQGYRNVWTPYAEFYHYESVSRGSDTSPEKKERLDEEGRVLLARYPELIARDPFYSPNLTIEREDFSLAWPPRIDSL